MAPECEGQGAVMRGARGAPSQTGSTSHRRSVTKGMSGCASASSVRKQYTSTCTG